MRYHDRDRGCEARRVNLHDYDDLCDLMAWCDATHLDANTTADDTDDDDGEPGAYLFAIPVPRGAHKLVRQGDWVIRDANGAFFVYRNEDWRPLIDPWPWFVSSGP